MALLKNRFLNNYISGLFDCIVEPKAVVSLYNKKVYDELHRLRAERLGNVVAAKEKKQ